MTRRTIKRTEKEKAEFQHDRGRELEKDTESWTPDDDDRLLDMWFYHGRGYRYIGDILGRSYRSVEVRIWRLVTGDRSCHTYKQTRERNRRDDVLSGRERSALWEALHGPGQRITKDRKVKMTLEQIAEVLNRPVEVIRKYESRHDPKGKGFGIL